MGPGRPRIAPPQELYFFAQEFYWSFRALAEGTVRLRLDQQKFAKAVSEIERSELTDAERAQLKTEAAGQIRDGHLQEPEMEVWLRKREADELFMLREQRRSKAAEEADRQLKVPGEPDVLEALLAAQEPEEIREICQGAFDTIPIEVERGVVKQVEVSNWPIDYGSMFPRYLSQYAEEFIRAKNDSRFPQSGRKTSRLKQIWFLSRALAGAVFGIKTRTAINLVGSKRPEQIFEESNGAKWQRTHQKRKRSYSDW